MGTYKILVNCSDRFKTADYRAIGEVVANSKAEALKLANEARKGMDNEVYFYHNMEGELRPFKIEKS